MFTLKPNQLHLSYRLHCQCLEGQRITQEAIVLERPMGCRTCFFRVGNLIVVLVLNACYKYVSSP
jgi:Fe-S-cluster containining protein